MVSGPSKKNPVPGDIYLKRASCIPQARTIITMRFLQFTESMKWVILLDVLQAESFWLLVYWYIFRSTLHLSEHWVRSAKYKLLWDRLMVLFHVTGVLDAFNVNCMVFSAVLNAASPRQQPKLGCSAHCSSCLLRSRDKYRPHHGSIRALCLPTIAVCSRRDPADEDQQGKIWRTHHRYLKRYMSAHW